MVLSCETGRRFGGNVAFWPAIGSVMAAYVRIVAAVVKLLSMLLISA